MTSGLPAHERSAKPGQQLNELTRIVLLLEYAGRRFHGCQYQVGQRTVQSELEKALATYFRMPVRVVFSGRTDAGVHASGQVAHFDIPQKEVDLWRMNWALNGILDDDLSIKASQITAPDFHARFSATSRQYLYRILNRQQRSALLRDTHYFISHPLELELMQQSSTCLLGRHNFEAFRSTNSDRSNTNCSVSRVELLKLGEDELHFWICADHFVYNMVRIIVGTLIHIGLGKLPPHSLQHALASGDRNLAGPTAPSWGLVLNAVQYPEAYNLFGQYSK